MKTYIELTRKYTFNRFVVVLTGQYTDLFKTPEYARNAAKNTPNEAAIAMALGLANGTSDKDGKGVIATCKALGLKHTYKAINEYFDRPNQTVVSDPQELLYATESGSAV